MRKKRTWEESPETMGLFYLAAHVLACGLGYLFGNFLFEEYDRIRLVPLILLYVLLSFPAAFVNVGLAYVLEFFEDLFRIRIKRLNFLLLAFLSYLVSIGFFIFLISFLEFWLSGWELSSLYGELFDRGLPAFIYFILPLGLSFFAMTLIGKAMGYSFVPEQKAMVQGSQSETASSTNHKEVKADKPIVWNFADYGKRVVVGQDHVIEYHSKSPYCQQ